MRNKMWSLLITGPSGSGKNYILAQHAARGANVFDLDQLGKKQDGKWVVPVDAVKKMLNDAKALPRKTQLGSMLSETPYIVCAGTSTNIAEISQLFDHIIILRIKPETYNRVARMKKAYHESKGNVVPEGWWKEDGGVHWNAKRDEILALNPDKVAFLNNDRAVEAKGAFHQKG